VPHSARSHSRFRSRSRSRRPLPATDIPPPGMPLAGPEEALRVILAAASDPPRAETIAVLLDSAHRGLSPCVLCDGASSADQVIDVAGLIAALAEQEPALAAVVLATTRPGQRIKLLPDDEAAFFRVRHDLAEVDVELLDWFLLDSGLAASVAELTDGCWRWMQEAPRW
jgi:DNA repair protein RadC